MMSASGTCRNRRWPPQPAASLAGPQRRGACSTRIRAHRTPPAAWRHQQIDGHDHDRHDGEGGGQRNIARRALVRIDRLADEGAEVADDAGNDVVAQRQREGEDRAGRPRRATPAARYLAEASGPAPRPDRPTLRSASAARAPAPPGSAGSCRAARHRGTPGTCRCTEIDSDGPPMTGQRQHGVEQPRQPSSVGKPVMMPSLARISFQA